MDKFWEVRRTVNREIIATTNGREFFDPSFYNMYITVYTAMSFYVPVSREIQTKAMIHEEP